MHVRLTQIIDYWLGVPLCFLLSAWHQLKACIGLSREAIAHPQTILFIELSEMGSAVLAHSALEECRQNYPAARICFLIFQRNRESVEILNTIPAADIITISDRTLFHFLLDSLRFFRWARRNRLDTVIDLELFSRATMILSYLSGATRRIGFYKGTCEGLYRGALLTHPVSYNSHRHMPLNFLALVRALSSEHRQCEYLKEDLSLLLRPSPVFSPTLEEREKIHLILRSLKPELSGNETLVVVNPDPGEALPMRGWGIDKYREAMSEILRTEHNVVFVLMGLPRSRHYARQLVSAFSPAQVIDFTGRTENLREMLTLFMFSRVLLTGDSGPAHFASLTPIYSVVLFGPETPVLYRPLGERCISLSANLACSPCLSAFNHRHTRCSDNICMQRIETETVVINLRRSIQRATTPVV